MSAADFLDGLGNVFTQGISKAIDAEIGDRLGVNPNDKHEADAGGPALKAGQAHGVAALAGNPLVWVGVAAAVVVVIVMARRWGLLFLADLWRAGEAASVCR